MALLRLILIPIALATTLLSAEDTGKLQILNPVLSQFEDGPALPAGQKSAPGETLFFRFTVAGFRVSEDGKVRLTGHVQAFDPAGVPIVPKDENVIGTSLRDEDKDWKPRIHSQFQLPSIAGGGTYRIVFSVTDDQSRQTASGEAQFSVAGPEAPPVKTLTIRRLGFYRTPDDEAPLRIPAYRAGDMIWMRFEIAGYQYGEQNALDVSYDVAVTAAGDRALFSQESAAVEKSQAFYPQPWVPGSFSLTLQSDTAPGTYTVTITAHDGIGKGATSAKAAFRVE